MTRPSTQRQPASRRSTGPIPAGTPLHQLLTLIARSIVRQADNVGKGPPK